MRQKTILRTSLSGKNLPKFLFFKPNPFGNGRIARISHKSLSQVHLELLKS